MKEKDTSQESKAGSQNKKVVLLVRIKAKIARRDEFEKDLELKIKH